MPDGKILKILMLIWAALWAGSLVWRFLGPDSGDGVARAVQGAMLVVGGQVLAAGFAMVIWGRGKTLPQGSRLRAAAMVPALVTVATVAAVGIAIALAMQRGG